MASANAAAAQQLATRAASGGPLDQLLQQFEFQTAQELLTIIMADLSAGINPRQMARDLSGALDELSYGRAETIARTESLTSWNDAALENYRANSDIVGSWMWMCMPGAGTCVSCLEEDGTIYSLDEELDDHPNGRCVKAPVTNDYGSILDSYGIPWEEGDFGPGPWDDRQTGEDWLLAQDAETQRAAFGGDAAYNAWKSGDAQLKDFVKIRHDPIYGDSIQQQSLRGMGLNARDYSAGSMAERAAREAEAKAAAEREAERAAIQERLTTAQAHWEAVRGELPERPLYVADTGAPGAVPSKVMQFSDYAAERKALLELWDAQAMRDALESGGKVLEQKAAGETLAPVVITEEKGGRAALDALFGRTLSDDEIAGLVGASLGDNMVIRDEGEVGIIFEVNGRGYNPLLAREEDGNGSYYASRVLTRDAEGKLSMFNAYTRETETGTGAFTERFVRQVEGLRRMGVDSIDTGAARLDSADLAKKLNGYYVMPRLGFNAPFNPADYEGIRMPKEVREARSILDVMATPQGRAWWLKYGDTFEGEFDLRAGSESMRTLEAYLQEKGLPALADASQGVERAALSAVDDASLIAEGKVVEERFIAAKDVEAWTADNAPEVPSVGYHYTTAKGEENLLEKGIESNVGVPIDKATRGQFYGSGFYMYDRPQEFASKMYGRGKDAKVVEVAVRMDNPLVIDVHDAKDVALWDGIKDRARDSISDTVWDATAPEMRGRLIADALREEVLALGHDGMIVRQLEADGTVLDQIVAYRPENVRIINDAKAAAEQAARELATVPTEVHGLGTLDEITARQAEIERLYGGTLIGDPMTLQDAAFGNNPYSVMRGVPLAGADPAAVAAVQQGQQLLQEAIERLATRLENNGAFMRFARYMGYNEDQIAAHLWSYDNALRKLSEGQTLAEEDAKIAAMTRGEAQIWAKQEALKDTVYGIFDAFHSIPAGGSELWVQTPLQVAMQEAVKAEFGLKAAAGYWSDEAIAAAKEEWGTYRNGIRAFMRGMYDDTQAYFREQGITEVELFRGLRWTADKAPADIAFDGRVVDSAVQMAPMTSWASNAEVALDYARDVGGAARPATAAADYGMLVATKVPVEQILSTPFTGFGTPTLREMILLGKPEDALALPFAMHDAPTLEQFLDRLATPAERLELMSGDTLALRGGEGAAGGHAAEDTLTARIDRIRGDATVPDIQDWLAQQIAGLSPDLAGRVELMDLNAQTARLIANASANLIPALPDVAQNLYRIQALNAPTEALAYVPRDGLSLIINTEKWADLAGLAERTTGWAEQGWWVAETPEQIIGHEIGHAVQINYKISDDTWVAAMDRVAAAGGEPLVSQYAGDKVGESFAETFALLVYGEPTDAQLPIVREMADLLRENNIDYNDLRAAVGEAPISLALA